MGVVWIRGAITAEFAAVRKRKESDQRILATETGVSLDDEDGSRPGSAEGASVRIAHGDDAAPDVGNAADLAADGAIGHIGSDNDLGPALREAIARLPDPKHRRVYTMRLAGATFAAIGEVLGVSTQRTSEIFEQAVGLLREDPTLQLLNELSR
jgi:DNA-directed RNA polymerase specialized sigma subunit